jgi:predicted nucleotide-binding protein
LKPVVFANPPAAGETIIEQLEAYIGEHGKAAYACVLLTPDDEGYKVGEESDRNTEPVRTSFLNLEWFSQR